MARREAHVCHLVHVPKLIRQDPLMSSQVLGPIPSSHVVTLHASVDEASLGTVFPFSPLILILGEKRAVQLLKITPAPVVVE